MADVPEIPRWVYFVGAGMVVIGIFGLAGYITYGVPMLLGTGLMVLVGGVYSMGLSDGWERAVRGGKNG